MLFLKLENIKPGMILGQSIYQNNQVLLAKNMILTPYYISRFQELGISGVYIVNQMIADLEIRDVLSRETKQAAFYLIQKTLTQVKQPEDLTSSLRRSIQQVIITIIQELLSGDDLTINLYNIKTFSDYIFAHSVNVCLFSLITGIARGYNEKKLYQLGIGAFLHDLGKIHISPLILDKPDRLTQEEFTEIKRHPIHGYTILRDSEAFDFTSANILYQHHEKMDGSGYPRNCTRDHIHEYARIVAISDIYDAVTSSRVYSPAMPNHEAIELIMAYASQQLDKDLVQLFLCHIPAFPLGSYVHLNNQSRGVVIGQNEGLPLRPLLLILEEKGQEVRPYALDLTRELSLIIEKTL